MKPKVVSTAVSSRRTPRGFTIVELLIVVGMVAVLSALAIVGYRKYIHQAQSSEAKAMIEAIRGAEEVYKSEMLTYLSVSTSQTYYPNTAPTDQRYNWITPGHADYGNWMMLNVQADSAVRFGYQVVANTGGTMTLPAQGDFSPAPTMPTLPAGVPWYVIQAKNSHWGDSRTVVFYSTSLGGEISGQGDTAN